MRHYSQTFSFARSVYHNYVRNSFPRMRAVLIQQDSEWTYYDFTRGLTDHFPRADICYNCLHSACGQYNIKRVDLSTPHLILFRFRGPFINYARTSSPRTRTVFIRLNTEWNVLGQWSNCPRADLFLFLVLAYADIIL